MALKVKHMPHQRFLLVSWLQGDSEKFQVCPQQSSAVLFCVCIRRNKRCQGNATWRLFTIVCVISNFRCMLYTCKPFDVSKCLCRYGKHTLTIHSQHTSWMKFLMMLIQLVKCSLVPSWKICLVTFHAFLGILHTLAGFECAGADHIWKFLPLNVFSYHQLASTQALKAAE